MNSPTSSTDSQPPEPGTRSTNASEETSRISWELCPVTGIVQVTWSVSADELQRIRNAIKTSAKVNSQDNPELGDLILRTLNQAPKPED